eukprot:Skav233614  [mRNA]  locus=scaffold109:237473:243119:- [translate_table: standard]
MAKRPLLISLLRNSSLYCPRPKGSPKSPASLLGSCQLHCTRQEEQCSKAVGAGRSGHSTNASWHGFPAWLGRRVVALEAHRTQGGGSVEAPVTPCRTSHLEKHSDDCHHSKPSVGQLRSELGLTFLRVLDLAQEGWESDAVVAWFSTLSGVLHAELTLTRTTSISCGSCLEESSRLNQSSEGNDLSTTKNWQLGQSSKTVWHICEFQAERWGKVSWKLVVFRDDVAHGSVHGMRPCLISTARRRLKVASSLSALSPSGSQNPMGSCTPSSFAGSKLA